MNLKNAQETNNIDIIKKLLGKYGSNIKYIENPTEEQQMIAVKQYGGSIKYIENPTEKVCIESVKQCAFNKTFIKNPTEKVEKIAEEQYTDYLLNK